MECTFGIVGDGFVVVGADTAANQSIVRLKLQEDKIKELDSHKIMGIVGEGGDTVNFSEFILANLSLYKHRNGINISTHAAANFTRGELATALRKGPYNVNLVLGGVDDGVPSLYFMDYLSCLHKMNTCAHGYGGMFMTSLFDKHWTPGMSVDQVLDLVDKCIAEIKQRLVVAPPAFLIKICDKDGVRVLGERS
mmetsp:Transcript_42460/g.51498  ORF Transcript_42460/g.51498 Transcript_42460/m.51498 type:complete len:194 (-) Transcript_42460:651-1232(-)|eukprot:CAMPEP_0197848422 /NCGR_PEP_ID=MMETSP1438-20131217/8696_1 /TAXON_ID=1461541 /ORGANISM="Pterosperma sp., Strain CCMP1384" /LENGTH=193 /DNA_ID=CAMNT_0043460661 /DNA_START=181 /DNA_END=762 /DNA_ORIENTATION=-